MSTKLTQRQRDKLIEAAQNSIFFTVVGDGEFPIDMLRYDKCWPNSSHDTSLVNRQGERRIECRGLTGPTPARWTSFGWTVVSVNGERVA